MYTRIITTIIHCRQAFYEGLQRELNMRGETRVVFSVDPPRVDNMARLDWLPSEIHGSRQGQDRPSVTSIVQKTVRWTQTRLPRDVSFWQQLRNFENQALLHQQVYGVIT